ncbi:DUF3703 domain-containing protein [Erythrobacter arachoides]|uniref:DUF3703 domain-containing protein n=1 Tax=Aurantiacibacter arachoides TaxID=1850444 RepID=A0A845A288_9SPHN|nr:DUF3703 domain-containing protein [Aurantiacibacter arachoides]MXO94255.1 DUF3703 domain-containing protein [Aurantiacibacter arachoides]GGD64914.1 hypothetical protein GCM10011411_26540 [Aurantiacibacter arachoides]
MADSTRARKRAFLVEEYRSASLAEDWGRFERAWHHLERAHIVAQTLLWPHCLSHWKMLGLAVRQRDWREANGQVARLALAPLGNLTGRLPTGNTGRNDVSAFARMEIPSDLRAVMDPTFD